MGLLLQTQQDVLRLDVCVDDFTLSVEVVQALQNLKETQTSCYLPYKQYNTVSDL